MAVLAATLALLLGASGARGDAFRPPRLAWSELAAPTEASRAALLEALTEVGLVSIADVPGLSEHRAAALGRLRACAADSPEAQVHTFGDGALRRTLATHTVPGPGGAQPLLHGPVPPACAEFQPAGDALRSAVREATAAFAAAMDAAVPLREGPLLRSAGGHRFESVADVVGGGEHLEHFHAYEGGGRAAGRETVDFHTDQGLFIAFLPGLMQEGGRLDAAAGFSVELRDGSRVQAELAVDDLVFMLGDGVEQFVNSRVRGAPLRAAPHAFRMPAAGASAARVWYGRMVLPPGGALHPAHGQTFDDLRRAMIAGDAEELRLGCSSPHAVARQLETTACAAGSLYCWHRCMAWAEEGEPAGVSPETCAARGLELKCVNTRDQLYVAGHGDYFPSCTNTTANATDYPTLPDYPRDAAKCTSAMFQAFSNTTGYEHALDLNASKLMWTVADGALEGKLVFDGIFGYLSFGLAGPAGSDKNGMHNASVILALRGGVYDDAKGMDLTSASTVGEYKIHHKQTSFRHWKTPRQSDPLSVYAVESTGCFVALSFKTRAINGIALNLTGADELLWAGNAVDSYAGYHGPLSRKRFAIAWAEGRATVDGGSVSTSTGWTAPTTAAPMPTSGSERASGRALLVLCLLSALRLPMA